MPPADQNETLAVLNTRLGALHEDVGEMKTVLRSLTEAINRLALIEQQQQQTAAAIERAFKTIEKVEIRCETAEKRIGAIEQQMTNVTRTSSWVDKAVWAAGAAAVAFVAAKAGLIGG